MQGFLMRTRDLRNSTDVTFTSRMITDNYYVRYSPEEATMHENVMKMVPTFKDVVTTLSKDPIQLEAFIAYVGTSMRIYARYKHPLTYTQLGSAAAAARQEDTASLKNDILIYILNNPSEDRLDPPLSKMDTKSARGFNHPATADCLCPMDMRARFLNNRT
jgi:hypothetical protein